MISEIREVVGGCFVCFSGDVTGSGVFEMNIIGFKVKPSIGSK